MVVMAALPPPPPTPPPLCNQSVDRLGNRPSRPAEARAMPSPNKCVVSDSGAHPDESECAKFRVDQ